MYSFPDLEPVCFMSSSNCCLLTCIQISQEAGQVVWYFHFFKNFPQFVVIHTVNITREYFPNISLTHSEQELNRPRCSFPMLEESQFWFPPSHTISLLRRLASPSLHVKIYHSLRSSVSKVSSKRLSDSFLSYYRQLPGLPW